MVGTADFRQTVTSVSAGTSRVRSYSSPECLWGQENRLSKPVVPDQLKDKSNWGTASVQKAKIHFVAELICIATLCMCCSLCSVVSAKSPKFISHNYPLEIIFPLQKKDAKDFILFVYDVLLVRLTALNVPSGQIGSA